MDYLLGVPFQEDIPLKMFMFPVNREAKLPEVFVEWAELAEEPATLDPARIDAMRDQWIAEWTEAVLH